MCSDIVERSLHRLMREDIRLARAHHFAAETEATVDRADVGGLKQHAVRITMHDTLHRTMRIVADRVLVLTHLMIELCNIRDELSCDWVVRIAAVDQLRQRIRNCDRIASDDFLERRLPLLCHQTAGPEFREATYRCHRPFLLYVPLRLHNGRPDHLLDPLCAGRQHHQPVETESDSARRWHLSQGEEEVLVHRIALAMDTLLFGHGGLEAGALFGNIYQ